MTPTVVRISRRICAPVARVFAAWTAPDQLRGWWGPPPMRCVAVVVELEVGGAYAIGHVAPDGTEVWIRGVFREIDPPWRLVYTWGVGASSADELVTVVFEEQDGDTEVTVIHERIGSAVARASHLAGWQGCLDGLARFVSSGG